MENTVETVELTVLELDAAECEKTSYKTTLKKAAIIRCWKRKPHQTWISLINGEKLLVEAEYDVVCSFMNYSKKSYNLKKGI